MDLLPVERKADLSTFEKAYNNLQQRVKPGQYNDKVFNLYGLADKASQNLTNLWAKFLENREDAKQKNDDSHSQQEDSNILMQCLFVNFFNA